MNLNTSRGFTYPVILVLIAVSAIASTVVSRVVSTQLIREKEKALIFRASAIRNAIERYYYAETPNQYPRTLEDLLLDPRSIYRTHLRKIYRDPFEKEKDVQIQAESNQGSWEMISTEEGFIIGVASKSNKEPIKKAGFPSYLELDETKTGYAQWQFLFRPVVDQGLPFIFKEEGNHKR